MTANVVKRFKRKETHLNHGLLRIDGNCVIYRIEKRAKDTQESREWFGGKYDEKHLWTFAMNSQEPLRGLLQTYQENNLYEFRIKRVDSFMSQPIITDYDI